LFINARARRIVKNAWIVGAVLVPSFDFIWNDRGFFQGQTVEELADLFARRCADQSLIGDGANDLMAGRAVRMCLPNEAKENYEQEIERFFHSTDECLLGAFTEYLWSSLSKGTTIAFVIREKTFNSMPKYFSNNAYGGGAKP
jgi:hypothetical protein